LMYNEGRVPLVNVRREEAELASARQMLANARRDLEVSLLQLKTVIGIDPESPIETEDGLPFRPSSELFARPEQPGPLPGGLHDLLALAEQQRPELRAASQRADSEHYGAQAVRSLYRPQVNGMA